MDVWALSRAPLKLSPRGPDLVWRKRRTVDRDEESRDRDAFAKEYVEYFELARDMLCTASPEGYFTRVNPAWERTLGYTEEELLSRPYVELVHPDDQERTLAEARRLRSAGSETVSFENRYLAADGAYHWLEWTARAGGDGTLFAAARDVTDQRRAQDDARLLAAIVRSTDDGVISTARNGVITSWNHSAERIYGYSAEEMIGRHIDSLLPPHRQGEDLQILAQVVTAKGGVSRVETERLAKGGSLVPVSLTVSPIRDLGGRLTGVSWIARDVTERKRLEAEIEYAARQDPVTGVYNRRHFERELLRQLPFTRRYGSGGAILLLDLDGFKRVNETLGHQAGDETLAAIARTLIDRLRVTDTIARLEADRFVVLLPLADTDAARKVGEELLERVERCCSTLAGAARELTCSIGIAPLKADAGGGIEDVLAAAEAALASAKQEGGARVAIGGETVLPG
jgi:diguanylate cyclase (GGDEF)-like protein/PAS domain S-box-containing protein